MKKNLTIVIVILGSIVTVLLIAGVVFDQRVREQGVQFATLSAQVLASQSAEQIQHSEAVSTAALTPDITKANGYPISADGEVDFINQIESLARGHNLTVTVNSVGLNSVADLSSVNLEYLELRVTVSGTWSSLYEFAAELEDVPQDIMINQMDFSNLSDNSAKSQSAWQGAFDISAIKRISVNESH